eukprot:GILK01000895.1.p1 GENE.GILK01000895.1~~GILK01000895.1.p1  ORF type:complete len:457 (+),score=91.27 GILK01000895.1:56-1372(+)
MAQYDLTKALSPFLDPHMILPLLEHVQQKNVFPENDIIKSRMDLLSSTNMVDFAMDNYKALNPGAEVPKEMVEKRGKVVSQLKRLQAECEPLVRVLDNVELVKQLRTEKLFNMSYLQENFQITPAVVDSLYSYAKFQFDCGNYLSAADYLYHFRALSNNGDKNFMALWGKLAAEILMKNWETAMDDFNRLRENIDNRTFSSQTQLLNQRTWLIHWGLSVFFNHPNGRNVMIDFVFSEKYLNTVQTSCPHILRYLAAAVITTKRRRAMLKDLVKVIEQEAYHYQDPITDFLQCLYTHFDFDGAQQKLQQCTEVLKTDYFLAPMHDEFLDNARLLIFETYCRIHQCIDIGMLASKLNMSAAEAEVWIVNLIRNARLDAKINSEKNQVIMGTQYPSVYQQVIEKTKGLSFRSSVLANNIEKRQALGATFGRRLIDEETVAQ